MLAEGEVAVDEGSFDRGKLLDAEVFLAEEFVDRAGCGGG
jgi:hypothetical protein